ncbi:MAG: helix-turn-helix transcriptional regulator [Chloroflexia bacterium]|nr:helix-turn-helix transcriptional regulator [Chloroflexia bacterium]
MTPTHEPGSPADQDASRARALSLLGEVFSSKVRASLLAWIVPRLDTRFSLTELSRELGMPISSLQHECYKLERLGVLKGRREGASRRYRMHLDHHLSRPLIGLVIATLGLDRVLRDAIADCGRVDVSVIAGPEPGSGSDRLVLAVIGEAGLEGLDRAQQRVALALGIDPDRLELAYFQRDDWARDGAAGHPLVRRLTRRPIQPISGTWPPG